MNPDPDTSGSLFSSRCSCGGDAKVPPGQTNRIRAKDDGAAELRNFHFHCRMLRSFNVLRKVIPVLYTLLCYNDESVTSAWSEEKDAAVMACLGKVHEKYEEQFGPVARLMPTTAATTFRKSEKIVTDGPYAETKEQLLGFYVIDVEDLDQAIQIARDLADANPGGAYEIRPIMLFFPNGPKVSDG